MARDTFTVALKKFAEKAKGNADKVVRKTILDMGSSLVLKSPVGNAALWSPQSLPAPAGYVGGRFRANWQYGVGEPNRAIVNKVDPSGELAIAGIVGKLEPGALGKVHWLTNSLAYGPRLEDGYSTQAPSGMVALTVLQFRNFIKEAVRSEVE